MTDSSKGAPKVVEVAQGRTLTISKEAKKVGEMDFGDLCDKPLGSTDYMAIC